MSKNYLASKITFNVATILFGLSFLITTIAQDDQVRGQLGGLLHDQGYVEYKHHGDEPLRFASKYNSINEVIEGNNLISKEAMLEGAVLLRNENNTLPLDVKKDKVSLFGVTSYDPMYSLDGAGEIKINPDRQEFYYDEFKKAGLTINEDLASWYQLHQEFYHQDYINIYDNKTNKNGVNATLVGASWNDLPPSKSDSLMNTGVFIVGRMTNEQIDLISDSTVGLGAKNNDYLKFTNNELSILRGMKTLKDEGKLDKIVVIFNQANPMTDNLEAIFNLFGVDSALWIGYPGSSGISGLAEILTGKVSPSGGISSSWYKAKELHPSYNYYANDKEILFQEGNYLGYKYAETRYEDSVLHRGNTKDFSYSKTISYPFGYGLSYGDFTYEIIDVEKDSNPSKNYYFNKKIRSQDELRKDGDDYVVKVKVTNISKSVTAKKNVQLYVQKPITEEDENKNIQKPSVELVGFNKTKELKPGEHEVLEIKLDANKYFGTYDLSQNDYVLTPGDYLLSLASNSHEAINNILKYKNIPESELETSFGKGDKNLVTSINVNENQSLNYEYRTLGEAKVTNLFDDINPNRINDKNDYVTFASRYDWKNTFDEAQNQIVVPTEKMLEAGKLNKGKNYSPLKASEIYSEAYQKFGDKYPTYRDPNSKEELIKLASMIDVPLYKDEGATEADLLKWEKFLDQLTWEETVKLTCSGLRKTEGIASIGKPLTNDVNGANGISWKFDMSLDGGQGANNVGLGYKFDKANRNQNPTGYPSENIIGSSFNKELAYKVGKALGEDALWSGASGIYAFGLGLQRNPYHGRYAEYYSEDPFLTGVMGGYSSLGAQEKGLYVYNKHFVLNDQETKRASYNTWIDEQTFRETYLRPFEIAIEIGNALNVMNSFNNIGSGWSGNNYNLMTKCLREEFRMKGFAITDFYQNGGMNMTYGALAGTDLPDGDAYIEIVKYGPETSEHGFLAQALRQSAKRILYVVSRSNAMNYIDENTEIIVHEATRPKVMNGINIFAISLFAISALWFVVSFFAKIIYNIG